MVAPIIVRSDIDAVVGAINVNKWADLSNNRDEDEITTRINYCIQLASDLIAGRLRLMTYDLTNVSALNIIKHVTAILAADLLYGPRRPTDAKPENDMMWSHRKEGKDLLKEIASGRLDLGLPRKCNPLPFVVKVNEKNKRNDPSVPAGIIAIWGDIEA